MAQKIINNPEDVAAEMMEGLIAAYQELAPVPGVPGGVLLQNRRKGKVAVVFGGGSGHEPTFPGFVGAGLADAAACGNVFASPDPGTITEVAKAAADGGAGVLLLYGNYAGDCLNFDMAEEMLADEGVQTAHVRVRDDCASAPPDRALDRRGIAGDFFALKIAGAAADAGLPLEEVAAATYRAMEGLRSIGVATAPGTIPGAAHPAFELPEGEIEYGMGIHGEPGIRRTQMAPADTLVETMYGELTADMPLQQGDEVAVLVNGLGSTTVMELAIVYRKLQQLLAADGVAVYDANLNSYCTCMEMGGFSITLLKLDDAVKRYLDAPCHCPYYTKL